jgi:3-deoxy-7-phosphoheptulonate synthase/chorismate mutase
MAAFAPEREQRMLETLVGANRGPFGAQTVRRLFKEIFRASLDLIEAGREKGLKVSRSSRSDDLTITAAGRRLGADPVIIAGPCAVEGEEQIEACASTLSKMGVGFLRAGAFKPRSSPYAFQGLGAEGLRMLGEAARRHRMASVTEVMDTRMVETVSLHADVLQIGARNMYNYDLLREVGKTKKPVLLKRGLSATIEELLWAAEYIIGGGNESIILCERGIRTFERETRNTLDISAIPILRQKSWLPVVVDVSHAAGRKDILAPLSRAALAAGACGIMVEVHPFPAVARSDSQQQLDFEEFGDFLAECGIGRAAVKERETPALEATV